MSECSPFLLIHGSGHGAWCWRDVLVECAARGLPARAIDLPSHGSDPTPIEDITLAGYVDAILGAIDRPVHLVGHSMAGYPITAAAIAAPDKIRSVTYLCAYVPKAGRSLVDMRRETEEQPLAGALEVSPDGLSFKFAAQRVHDLLYQDCGAGVLTYAAARLCPQAIAPQTTPIDDPALPPGIARHYVICEKDHTIPPAHQEEMASAFTPEHVYRLGTGHSPFFADPTALVDVMEKVGRT